MSTDTVDDLHAAEDRVGELAGVLHRLVLAVDRLIPDGAPELADEMIEAFEVLDISSLDEEPRAWCRPSCEYDEEEHEWLCGDDCGCRALHPEYPGHADEEVPALAEGHG